MTRTRAALIDAHVHFHSCFDAVRFIDTAHQNFARAAVEESYPEFAAFLLLVETADANWFDYLRGQAQTDAPVGAGWKVHATAHPCQLRLIAQGKELNVISGYQIVTQEKLEVLALGSRDRVPDGLPVEEVLRRVNGANALAVVPWGFGKWLGKRGELVRQLLDQTRPAGFFLGDNSNRLAGLPEPKTFARARANGIEILLGTDPLPFPKETGRVGSAGFSMQLRSDAGELDSWDTVRRNLLDSAAIKPFGHFEGLPSFLKNQIAMQMYKRLQSPRRAS